MSVKFLSDDREQGKQSEVFKLWLHTLTVYSWLSLIFMRPICVYEWSVEIYKGNFSLMPFLNPKLSFLNATLPNNIGKVCFSQKLTECIYKCNFRNMDIRTVWEKMWYSEKSVSSWKTKMILLAQFIRPVILVKTLTSLKLNFFIWQSSW